MKNAENLKARLAENMRESMGIGRSVSTDQAGVSHPGANPAATPFHGGTTQYEGCARVKDAFAIELGRIMPDPDQPRKEFDQAELEDLAESMKARGQLQPIRVRWDANVNRWVIIAGERRYRAALLAGMPTLLCMEAREPLTADDILEDQLVENCLRSDLKPIEQARAFRTLMDRRGWSYRQLAESLRIGLGAVSRAMALLDLPADLQAQVDAGTVPASAASEVARLEDDADRREMFERITAGELNRDEVAEVVRERARRPNQGRRGRGAAKSRKVTVQTFRANGYKVTVENRRGVEPTSLAIALRQILTQLNAGTDCSTVDPASSQVGQCEAA